MSDMTAQRSALADARRLRAEFLHDVHLGRTMPIDLLDAAREDWAIPLRQMSLEQVFLSSGMSARGWRLVRTRMLATLGIEVRRADLTVGWVIDPRAGGRRHYALGDALRDRDQAPWPGFPWLPRPGASEPEERSV
ncbi:hypothetical protein ASC77_18635 [Nocardioides sp. Root1257]|uniref:hypothetical protein n=1 Tax=unclassified Nocardioides TaxID=2615069 RepID=UPI0007002571|nr:MULTISPECIES: hypothetical protein [unclassified Nocardioides]KQW45934.1 hypothetical protein ASC77_18635 [Nocardioides sp. Root1257]KRC43198.1 hypothetical protein ASE24_19600 [Nocardioides sp. Root224]